MKSQRQLKVGQLIKKYISEIFLRDGLLSSPQALITIAQVDVSPDIKMAKVYLNIFGTGDSSKIVNKLNSTSSHFRYKLSSLLTSKTSPEIVFILDDTHKKAAKIEDLIANEGKKFDS